MRGKCPGVGICRIHSTDRVAAEFVLVQGWRPLGQCSFPPFVSSPPLNNIQDLIGHVQIGAKVDPLVTGLGDIFQGVARRLYHRPQSFNRH